MSLTLTCEILPSDERPELYWWPLLFETMRRLDFGFVTSEGQELGQYLVVTEDDADVVEDAPFLRLWQDIASGRGSFYVKFWSRKEPRFIIDCGISHHQAGDRLQVNLDMEGEALMVSDEFTETDTPTSRLHRWLDGIRLLYGFCTPAVVELGHEHAGVYHRMGTIGKPLVLESFAYGPDSAQPYEGSVAHERLPDGAILSIVNPVYLLHGVGELFTLG